MSQYKWDRDYSGGSRRLEVREIGPPETPLWRNFDNGAVFITWFLFGIVALVTLIFLLISWIGWHQAAVSCTSWGQLNGYKTQFVKFNWFDRTCIAQVGPHHWLPVSQIRGVGGVTR